MVELGIGTHMKQVPLHETAARSVKVVAGTRNHLDLQLRALLEAGLQT